MKFRDKEIPKETAALVMAYVSIDDLLITGKLTEDIAEELRNIQPLLNYFLEIA